MENVMQDLETLGKDPGCVILSIGACAFDRTGTGQQFYMEITRQSCLSAGLVEDPETVAWWNNQSPEARKVLEDNPNKHPLRESLDMFSMWFDAMGGVEGGGKIKLWGNGSDFDNTILAAAYRAVGMVPPWKFWNSRCYRTLKGLYPNIPMERSGTHHNALDDAVTQARHAVAIFQAASL